MNGNKTREATQIVKMKNKGKPFLVVLEIAFHKRHCCVNYSEGYSSLLELEWTIYIAIKAETLKRDACGLRAL